MFCLFMIYIYIYIMHNAYYSFILCFYFAQSIGQTTSANGGKAVENVYIYIYIHIYTHVIYIYIYMYMLPLYYAIMCVYSSTFLFSLSNWARFWLGSFLIAFLPNDLPNLKRQAATQHLDDHVGAELETSRV